VKIGRGPATVIGCTAVSQATLSKPHRLLVLREKGGLRKWPLTSRGVFLLFKFSHYPRPGRFVPRFRCINGRYAVLLVSALLLSCAAKLSAQAAAPVAAPSLPNTHEVVDEVGRTLRLPVVPTRIVSLAPSLTETVYALGLQDRLVGDTDYCDYPPDAQKKPKVGGAINPNLEEIAALSPDLVLVTKDLNRLETVRALDTLGIPSYSMDAAHSVDGIISSTEKLAEVLGASQAGKMVGEDLHHRLSTLQEKLRSVAPTHVLFVVWTEPLISAGKNTFIADALRKAGAISIVDSTQDWPQMSLEEVVRLQPDYLVFAAAHAAAGTRDFEALVNRPGWHLLDAVHNHHYAVISDAVNRPAPRIISAIEDLAHQLHPAAFEDSPNPEKEIVPTNSTNPVHPHAAVSAPHSLSGVCFTESSCAL
jgi:iron complex transport system substrate-binding protein